MEQSVAFFKAALVLLSMFKKELSKPTELSQFLSLFNSLASKLSDVESFKRKTRDLFLNVELLEACRALILNKKYEHLVETPQAKHAVESCAPETPYCAWNRTVFKKDNNDFIIRTADLVDCLKFNYFDPFKFRFNIAFNVEFLQRFKGISFERLNRNFYQKRNSTIDANLITNLVTDFDPLRTTVSDKLLADRTDTDEFTYSTPSSKPTEDDLLILRGGHICKLIRTEYFKKRLAERFKAEYFFVVYKILFKYLGRSLKCYTFQNTRIDCGPLADEQLKAALEHFRPLAAIRKPTNVWKHREKVPERNIIDQSESLEEERERQNELPRPQLPPGRVGRERRAWSFVQSATPLSEDVLSSLRLLEVVYLKR